MNSLPEEFMRYPMRRYGMDHDLYQWRNLFAEKKTQWPNEVPLAMSIVVPLEWFPLDSTNKPFRPPGGMLTPYPDLRHYSSRDYGNRVGIVRLLEVFAHFNLSVTFVVNANLAARYPELIEAINEPGCHEIAAHGLDMNHLHHGGMTDERAWIEQTLELLRTHVKSPVRGWLSPARSQSASTLRLLAEAKLDYCLDWVNDDMPFYMLDGKLIAMPCSEELCDRQIILDYRHTEDSFVEQVQDAAACLQREAGKHGGRILSLSLYPWVSGLPYRIDYLRKAMDCIFKTGRVWSATNAQILDIWKTQHRP